MKITNPFILVSSVLLLSYTAQSQLFFNELVLRNQTGITDVFAESDDWLELYNSSGSIIDLAGYYFSDSPSDPLKFQIPTDQGSLYILPNDHLILWLDKDPEQGLSHLNIRLSSDGEGLTMTAPDGLTLLEEVEFPAQAPDVSYGRSSDGADDWIFFSVPTPDAPNAYVTADPEILFVNEIMANNLSYISDQAEEFEPWFEVYNPNSFAVNLADYRIQLDAGPLYTIQNTDPIRTVIEANGFAIFWMDDDLEQGSNHAQGSLSTTGGTLKLINPGDDGEADSYTYPAIEANLSYGRSADGGGTSVEFVIPTPRVTNSLVVIEPEPLFINEIMANNTTDVVDESGINEDWIEIYNPNNYAVNLAGYYLSDNPDVPNKFQITFDNTDSTTIAANDWMLFWADEDGDQGVRHLSFKLNSMGEEVTLYSPDAFSVADRIEYFDMAQDTSYGRLTDGNAQWVLFSGTTPDASNGDGILASVEQIAGFQQNWNIGSNPVINGLIQWTELRDVQLFDVHGKTLRSASRANELSVNDLPSGPYLLRSERGEVVRVMVVK